MSEITARLALPMIVPGQAQKEMTHNEALAALDIAVQAAAVAMGLDTPPDDPVPGACWIVGDSPTGAWTGRASALAGWTVGGWRFVTPRDGFRVSVAEPRTVATFHAGAWHQAQPVAAIADPVGGDVIDPQARTAIAQILAALRDHDIVSPGM